MVIKKKVLFYGYFNIIKRAIEKEKEMMDVMKKEKIYNKLVRILPKERILIEEPMAKHTTFRIGGPADFYISASSIDEVKHVVQVCKEEDEPYYVIGNGSNLLVGDQGFRGVILQIGNKMMEIDMMHTPDQKLRVVAQAGILLSKLSMSVTNEGYRGLEFAAGIPGTLGGAVTMNAGAYGGEIKDDIVSATVLDQEGNVLVLNKEELQLSYRHSIVLENSYVVLEAVFELEPGNKEESLGLIRELNGKRKEKQPLEYPSAGSTFKRPEGHFAGKLIMDAGLRGYRVGDMAVSDKHCGFVINLGHGTAKEAKQLIEEVTHVVKETFDVTLEPEVRMIGEFN